MRLEPEFWDALLEVCQREGQNLQQVIHCVDSMRWVGGRTSAVRVFLLNYFRRGISTPPAPLWDLAVPLETGERMACTRDPDDTGQHEFNQKPHS
jgi:predicted DNA-binding ribbon-helix-helix protein